MSPHADDFHCLDIVQNLIDQAMMDIDSPGTSACQVTYQFLEWRRRLVGILTQNTQQALCSELEAGTGDLPGIALGLLGKYQSPCHHFNSSEH